MKEIKDHIGLRGLAPSCTDRCVCFGIPSKELRSYVVGQHGQIAISVNRVIEEKWPDYAVTLYSKNVMSPLLAAEIIMPAYQCLRLFPVGLLQGETVLEEPRRIIGP
jgi:hypothetical protein